MRYIKIAVGAVGLVFLFAVFVVGLGGFWVDRNLDTVAEAAVDASGIKDQLAQAEQERCRRERERFQALWDEAVDSGTLEQREAAINLAESSMKAACDPN